MQMEGGELLETSEAGVNVGDAVAAQIQNIEAAHLTEVQSDLLYLVGVDGELLQFSEVAHK